MTQPGLSRGRQHLLHHLHSCAFCPFLLSLSPKSPPAALQEQTLREAGQCRAKGREMGRPGVKPSVSAPLQISKWMGARWAPEMDKGLAGEAERHWSPTSSPDPSQVSGLRLSEPRFPLL